MIEPWNAASIRVAEKCGFSPDGLLPEHGDISGERTKDVLRYGVDRQRIWEFPVLRI